MQLDEDGPRDVDGAVNASDYVVLAQVVGETGGARFDGNDGETPEARSGWRTSICTSGSTST